MLMTKERKEILLGFGHPESDLPQIEEAMNCRVTHYTLNGKRISRKKAIDLLGEKVWLSGISRSAFHWTASRPIGNTNEYVCFDSSALFR